MWHALWSGDLLQQWSRKPPLVTSEHAGKGMADPGRWRDDAPGKALDSTFLSAFVSRDSWVAMPPAKLKLSCMQFQALLKYGQTWWRLKRSWLSCLAIPGCLLCITSGDHKGSYLILSSTEYGWAGVRCRFKKTSQQLSLVWNEPESVLVDAITDTSGYNMASVEVLLPDESERSRSDRLAVRIGKDDDLLLKWHAKRGFCGLTVAQVQHIGRHLNVPDLKCRGSVVEDEFIKGMIRHCLGTDACSEAVFTKALECRHKVPGRRVVSVPEAPKGEGDDDDDDDDFLETEVWPQEVLEELHKHDAVAWGQVEKYLTVTKGFDESWKEFENEDRESRHGGGVAHDGGHAAASSLDAPAQRKFSPITPTSYTAQEAKQWLPEGWVLSKDTTENRWRLSKKGYVSKSRSYGAKSGLTEHQCLLSQLAYAWAMEKKASGIQCPWDLAGL